MWNTSHASEVCTLIKSKLLFSINKSNWSYILLLCTYVTVIYISIFIYSIFSFNLIMSNYGYIIIFTLDNNIYNNMTIIIEYNNNKVHMI